jgi:hypothetical protein
MRIKDKWKQSRELKMKKREKNLTMAEWIDRMLKESHPSILRVSGYREQLLKPFETAVDYLDGLISAIPGPFSLSADRWDKDPMTHALFVSPDEIRSVLNKAADLKSFFKKSGLKTCIALMTATKKERTIFGTGMEGEIIHRDVPKVTVEFYDHRIVGPAADEEESRKELVHRGLYVLTSNALEDFTEIKSIVEELKTQRRILDYKIKIQKNRERGLEGWMVGTSRSDAETAQAQKVIEDIDKQLKEFEQGAGTPRDFLRKLEKVLLSAGNFLTEKPITLRLDWMGVKQKETSAEKSLEINLAELEIPERAKRIAVLAGISADECSGL